MSLLTWRTLFPTIPAKIDPNWKTEGKQDGRGPWADDHRPQPPPIPRTTTAEIETAPRNARVQNFGQLARLGRRGLCSGKRLPDRMPASGHLSTKFNH